MKTYLAWLISQFVLTRRTLAPTILAAFTLSMLFVFNARAADPQVSNVQASQRTGTKLVDITYDVTAVGAVTVSAAVSTNRGVTYDLPATHFSGSGYGSGVTPGTGKAIVWDAGADWDGQYSIQMRVKVTADDGYSPILPPDPSSVATAPEPGVVTLVSDSTAFLYTGTNAIQTGVATGTIKTVQAAVLRGRVLDESQAALSGVIVTINQHQEYGQTLTRTNGAYDLAVNGGGTLSLNYARTNYLTIQRTLDVPWQDYVNIEDVMLKAADTNVMVATLPSASAQAVYGSLQTDTDGSRQAVVIIPANTRAYVFTPAGATQETSTLTTHLTEFTVGTNGAAAMPGDLPPTVAYTYALELAAAEAQVKIAGRDVLFSTNVYFYVDNFLGMPTGIQVPMGYYDDAATAWVPSQDGRVVELAGTNASGLAELIVTTNGVPANTNVLSALGFTDSERLLLTALYGPAMTQTLWRVPINHFSRFDPNYGVVAASGAKAAAQPLNQSKPPTDPNSQETPSLYGALDIENRVFRESIPIAGTPFALTYASDRSTGCVQKLSIPLSGSSITSIVRRITLQLGVAGRKFEYDYAPDTNLTHEFTWDGQDAYGRALSGEQPVNIRLGYVYDAYYALPPSVNASFGLASGVRISSGIPARQQMTLWQEQRVTVGPAPATIGGWNISAHHSYDPVSRTLHLGDGRSRRAETLGWKIQTVAGNGSGLSAFTNGSKATDVAIGQVYDAVAAPDGTIYMAYECGVFKLTTSGTIYRVAGQWSGGYSGDGGPATNAVFSECMYITLGPDGSIYVADTLHNERIRKIATNGIVTTVAGNGSSAYSGDGGPATNAALWYPHGIAVAPDGTLYIGDYGNHRVRRVGPDGIIHTLAGDGGAGDPRNCNGIIATNASIAYPFDIALMSDGQLLVSFPGYGCVLRFTTDGLIYRFAGKGDGACGGDGGLATNASVHCCDHICVGNEDSVYISQRSIQVARWVAGDGTIYRLAGTASLGFSGDGGHPTRAQLDEPYGICSAPDGSVYIADHLNRRLRKIVPPMPGMSPSEMNYVSQETYQVPSEDGSVIYTFNDKGRHIRTVNALTGQALLTFGYTNYMLATITDGDGNVTTFERPSPGSLPTAIESPYGQHTALGYTPAGFLASVANQADETTLLAYTNGLLNSVTGAKGAAYKYQVQYDADGHAMRASDPEGGSTALGATALATGREVTWTSAVGRVGVNRFQVTANDDQYKRITSPDGTVIETYRVASGYESNIYPTGAKAFVTKSPDPRFGMVAPVYESSVVRLPSGLAMTVTVNRAVSASADSIAEVTSMTNLVGINGRVFTNIYIGSNRTVQTFSPMGRQTVLRINDLGRMVSMETPGLAMVTNSYDEHGRLVQSSAAGGGEERTLHYTYGADGFLDRAVDPLGCTNRLTRDAVGRISSETIPDGRVISATYDAHGNRISLTPPDRPDHAFVYNLADMLTNYAPPAISGIADPATHYTYNLDRQITQVSLPGGQNIGFAYDAAKGRLTAITLTNGSYNFSYHSNGLAAAISAPSGVTVSNDYNGSLLSTQYFWGAITGRIGYVYDNSFRLATLTVNGGHAISYQYDADGLLTNAGLCGYMRHAANGLLIGSMLSNVTETLAYNAFGEATNYSAACLGTNILSVAYACDKLGRITGRTEVVEMVTNSFGYDYDLAGRLVRVKGWTNGTGFTNTYQYDANGNRTNALVGTVLRTASYDSQDRLTNQQSAIENQQFFYNDAGFLTNKVENGSNTFYQYDALGNLLGVTLPSGGPVTNIQYLVDGLGRRVGRVVDGTFSNGWLYAGWLSPIAEIDSQSNVVSVFVYGRYANVPDYMVRDGNVYRLVTDHLGSVRRVVQSGSGEIVQRIDYDEWGRILTNSASGVQPFGFAGGLADPDSGLVRFGARDYYTEAGRWTARDPVLFAGGAMNLYAYVNNNPVNLVDKSGLGPEVSDDSVMLCGGSGDSGDTPNNDSSIFDRVAFDIGGLYGPGGIALDYSMHSGKGYIVPAGGPGTAGFGGHAAFIITNPGYDLDNDVLSGWTTTIEGGYVIGGGIVINDQGQIIAWKIGAYTPGGGAARGFGATASQWREIDRQGVANAARTRELNKQDLSCPASMGSCK